MRTARTLNICLVLFVCAATELRAQEPSAHDVVAAAVKNIERLNSYRIESRFTAALRPPDSSDFPVDRSQQSVMTVVYSRTGVLVRDELKSVDRMWPLRFLPWWCRYKRTSICDGKWVYAWPKGMSGSRVVDHQLNRSLRYPNTLYDLLLKDKSLRYRGRMREGDVDCFVVESSLYKFIQLLDVSGQVRVAIDANSGFPVVVRVANSNSQASVEYSRPQTNISFNASLFVPPADVKFTQLQGSECESNAPLEMIDR